MCPAGLTLSISNIQCQIIGETALLPVPFLVPILFHLMPHLDDFQQAVKRLWSTVIRSSLSLIDYTVYQVCNGLTAKIMHDLTAWHVITLLKAESCMPVSYLISTDSPRCWFLKYLSVEISVLFADGPYSYYPYCWAILCSNIYNI